jgi:hypothetical protein
MSTPTPQPPTGWMPPPPPQKKPSFFSKRWVQVAGAGLAGLIIGVAAGGSSDVATTDTVAQESADSEVTDRLQRQLDDAQKRNQQLTDDLVAARAQANAEEQPAAPAPAPAEPAPDGDLSDGSFTSEPPQLKDDGLGDFGGTARVTNVSDGEKSALLTYTFFKGGEQVGTAQGSASEVGAGETATVQLVSTDEFVTGVDRIEFQVDGEF